MDISELQSRIHQLQEEKPVVRLNRLFAAHLQNEVDSYLVESMKGIMASFEDEWSLDLTDEGKTNLMMGMDVRVEVNSVQPAHRLVSLMPIIRHALCGLSSFHTGITEQNSNAPISKNAAGWIHDWRLRMI